LTDHPTPGELEALLYGGLTGEQARAVVRHLLGGCEVCQKVVAPGFLTLLRLGTSALHTEAGAGRAYDDAVERALAGARGHASHLEEERAKSRELVVLLERRGIRALERPPRRLRGQLAKYFALLERSWALRHDDPRQMVALAYWAVVIAGNLDVQRYGARQVEDFLCRACADLGNALRVADQLAEAEATFARAHEHFLHGTQDELLQARLFDLHASLYGDCRKFDLALTALDVVCSIHKRRGNLPLAGRALISKGICAGYDGSPEQAAQLTREGLALIDASREPDLAFAATHNLALWLVECGRLREARSVIVPLLWHRQEAGGSLNLLKIRWLEGRIKARQGDLERADSDFLAVKQGFIEAGKPYFAAGVTLDLAAVRLRRGMAQEAWNLGTEAAQVFLSLRIQREALGAVLILQKACEMRQATANFLDSVADYMRRAERDPSLHFDPQV
jgi:hypothetical protein